MTFPADKAENSPHFKKLSAEVEGVGQGDFERDLVNLEVPDMDVRADGEIV